MIERIICDMPTSRNPQRIVSTTGGPLVLMDNASVAAWGGVQVHNTTMGPVSDYERACQIRGYLGTVDIQHGCALVLNDMPMDTTVIEVSRSELWVIRFMYGECREYENYMRQEAEQIFSLGNVTGPKNMKFRISGNSFSIFDASSTYLFACRESNVIDVGMDSGNHVINTYDHTSQDFRLIVHMMSLVPQS